jgi:SAM-dependent methyltransferase
MSIAENQYYNQFLSTFKGFYYNGEFYNYYAHPYNATWMNERTVEIPVFARILGQTKENDSVLEVGNVLNHYGLDIGQNIVDLYEKEPRVINSDIIDYHPTYKYDLIVSISTIEHIGKDDEPRPVKALEAIDHLKNLLAPGGRLVISIPLRYNPDVDNLLSWEFDHVYYLQSHGRYDWRQVTPSFIKAKYDLNNGGAKTVAFAYYKDE